MPVVTVALPRHSPELLGAVADALARSLDLGEGDVIASHIATSAPVASGGVRAQWWPLVSIHGSDRGDAMASARTAVEAAVRDWAAAEGVALGGVWVTWILP